MGVPAARARRVALVGVLALMASVAALAGAPAGHAQVTGPGGTWERTDSLNVARYDHTTTLLATGKVLAAGGRSLNVTPGQTFASAELYDPITEQWDMTGSLTTARFDHTATVLPDGRVLVAGGFGPAALTTSAQPVQDTAELYDPATGTWTPTGSMNVRRALHAAALLADGRVLVAGGRTCNQPPPATCDASFRTATAELYDPATGTWTLTGSMNADRHTTAAVRLLDGRVLVPAGFTSTTPSGSNTADVYDPATGTWSLTGNLNRGRSRQGAMLLHDGRAMVALGFSGPGVPNPTTELYNPATNSWTLADDIEFNSARFNFHYVVMPNGKPVVAGGQFFTFSAQGIVRDSHIYDPASNTWIDTSPLNDPHGSGSSLSNSQPMVVLSGSPTSYVADPTKCGRHCGKALLAGQHPTGSSELFTAAGTCYGFDATITGTDNGEDLNGTPGRDVILGLGGDDRINGADGDDIVCGGAGNDQIAGGTGADIVLGGDGVDRVAGGDGNDFMFGESGNDQLAGGNDTDTGDGGADTDGCLTEVVRGCP